MAANSNWKDLLEELVFGLRKQTIIYRRHDTLKIWTWALGSSCICRFFYLQIQAAV